MKRGGIEKIGSDTSQISAQTSEARECDILPRPRVNLISWRYRGDVGSDRRQMAHLPRLNTIFINHHLSQ
jgi:hypothetical protein